MSLEPTATVVLGGKEYVAKAVPIGKLVSLAKQLSGAIDALSKSDNVKDVDSAITLLVTQFGGAVETFVRTFVPTLPEGLLTDAENGPTLPELVEAFKAIAKLNRLDSLSTFIQPLEKALQGTVLQSNK
ncbi:hypothetical protein GCM10025857_06750 [Alicyclobacillus contaminans]|uniref:hypothetical protein n=1 Tax=Alicyclobacillus contaminans TaxID=392016 RepID=UPI00047D8805|nr:hypothetical protein [Alicyclobacillus contaminans]GMA49318.1 hypothetical protein GCM10025857_06750 [Alicyclobacillus contaminans]